MDQPVSKTVLSNGIRILTKKMPHLRSVSMGVWVNVGARDETLQENGLSHLIEHMLFKGTATRSAFQIAKEFDAIGGQTNAFTAMENTCYHARVMDTHVETMVDILSDILLHSRFDARDIEKERPVILQEIRMVEGSPDDYVHVLSGQNFWGDHPLGRSILGTPANIMRFDAGMIKQFFKRCYHPHQIVVSGAGNLEHNHFVDLVANSFEGVLQGRPMPPRNAANAHARVLLHHRDLEQAHICLATKGLALTHPQRYAFSLMNTIFGGNMSSRLFQTIREQRGLAYAVYSFIASHYDTGMFGIYAAVDPKHAVESTALILEAMEQLAADRVAPQELQSAKEYTKGNILLAAESADNQMVRLAQNEIHFKTDIPLQTVVDKIDAVTEDDIGRLAHDLFADKQVAVTMLGPVIDKTPIEDLLRC
jgi:predicted Zn-dependent peptidase